MKVQTTQKNVMNSFAHVVSAPYCALQHVFAGTEPIAYTAGKYGWNADIYDVGGGIAIVTGYRPFGEKIDRDFFPAWEAAAQKAISDGGALTEIVRDTYARWANGTDEKYYISYPRENYKLLDSILAAVKRSKNAAVSDWDYRRGMVDVASPETVEREKEEFCARMRGKRA